MRMATEDDIEAFAGAVRDVLGDRVAEVLLYGSYARDQALPGSDIDIAILVTEKHRDDRERAQDVAEEWFTATGLRFSPRVFAVDEFDQKVADGYSFFETVAADGVPV